MMEKIIICGKKDCIRPYMWEISRDDWQSTIYNISEFDFRECISCVHFKKLDNYVEADK